MMRRLCRACEVPFVTPPFLLFLALSSQRCESQAAKLAIDRIIAGFLYGGVPWREETPVRLDFNPNRTIGEGHCVACGAPIRLEPDRWRCARCEAWFHQSK